MGICYNKYSYNVGWTDNPNDGTEDPTWWDRWNTYTIDKIWFIACWGEVDADQSLHLTNILELYGYLIWRTGADRYHRSYKNNSDDVIFINTRSTCKSSLWDFWHTYLRVNYNQDHTGTWSLGFAKYIFR